MKTLQPSCNHVGKIGGTAKVYSQSDIDLLGGGGWGEGAGILHDYDSYLSVHHVELTPGSWDIVYFHAYSDLLPSSQPLSNCNIEVYRAYPGHCLLQICIYYSNCPAMSSETDLIFYIIQSTIWPIAAFALAVDPLMGIFPLMLIWLSFFFLSFSFQWIYHFLREVVPGNPK